MRIRKTKQLYHKVYKTPFGPLAIVYSENGNRYKIIRILLSRPDSSIKQDLQILFPQIPAATSSRIDTIADHILSFMHGEDHVFSLECICLELCSVFQQHVLRTEHAIPRGRISSYQKIAAHISNPLATRAVGTALATNPFPIIIPCHRAIRTDGSLGGYQGGLSMKRALLEMEGICFTDSNKVRIKKFFY